MPIPKDPKAEALWRQRMSEKRRQLWLDPEYRAARCAERKGKPKSEAHKAAISKSHIGILQTPESIEKIKEARAFQVFTPETRAKMSKVRKGKKTGPNPKIAKAIKEDWEKLSTKERINKTSNGLKATRAEWDSLTQKQKTDRILLMTTSQKQKATSLEMTVKHILDSLEIQYEQWYPVSPYSCDFYIPSKNLIIEADGDYWHKDKEYEAKRDAHIISFGYRILHLPESVINSGPQEQISLALSS